MRRRRRDNDPGPVVTALGMSAPLSVTRGSGQSGVSGRRYHQDVNARVERAAGIASLWVLVPLDLEPLLCTPTEGAAQRLLSTRG
jgi:hypothetical protein